MDEKIKILFDSISKEKKSEVLDHVIENYLIAGFGVLNKTDFEPLLFHALLQMGCNTLSDYDLGIALQITTKKVQSLKEKVSVKYPSLSRTEAITLFQEKLSYCKIDGLYIDVPIYDVALKNHIEAILDENNILLHKQLNSKVFRLRMDDLFDLLLVINPDDLVKDSVIQLLRKNQGRIEELDQTIDVTEEKTILTKFKGALHANGPKLAINALAAVIPGGTLAKTFIDVIIAST